MARLAPSLVPEIHCSEYAGGVHGDAAHCSEGGADRAPDCRPGLRDHCLELSDANRTMLLAVRRTAQITRLTPVLVFEIIASAEAIHEPDDLFRCAEHCADCKLGSLPY